MNKSSSDKSSKKEIHRKSLLFEKNKLSYEEVKETTEKQDSNQSCESKEPCVSSTSDKEKHASSSKNNSSPQNNNKMKTVAAIFVVAFVASVVIISLVLACLKTNPTAFGQFCTMVASFIEFVLKLIKAFFE